MKPVLCIISVYRPELVDELVHSLGIGQGVQVVMDRRRGERRQTVRAASAASRDNDRRQRSIDDELRTEGFAVVRPE